VRPIVAAKAATAARNSVIIADVLPRLSLYGIETEGRGPRRVSPQIASKLCARIGHFELTPLNASPERVRDTGTVYWQAEFAGRPAPSVIKVVVGEDWILEWTPSGDLKFVLYMNTFHHTLADSAPLDL
jgi:hypothetical protein